MASSHGVVVMVVVVMDVVVTVLVVDVVDVVVTVELVVVVELLVMVVEVLVAVVVVLVMLVVVVVVVEVVVIVVHNERCKKPAAPAHALAAPSATGFSQSGVEKSAWPRPCVTLSVAWFLCGASRHEATETTAKPMARESVARTNSLRVSVLLAGRSVPCDTAV